MGASIHAPSRLWRLPLLAAGASLLAAGIVRAASQIGAEALLKEAGAACQIASKLEQPRVLWSSPDYERQAALIIAGKWPTTRMKGDEAYMLCLFDKQSAKVELREIEASLFR